MSDYRALAECVANDLERIRAERPLVHQITNEVVMNFTANGLLALGALPVMAHSPDEAADVTAGARALVLNLGTPTTAKLQAMTLAGRRANELDIPVVFDPVGVGATAFRCDGAARLLDEVKITLVRGNLGEVATLAGLGGRVSGVESAGASRSAPEVASAASTLLNCAVAVTGAEDVIVNRSRSARVQNGHPLLRLVTGTGCLSSALCGAFLAVQPDPLAATCEALVALGVAAEIAAQRAAGPGSLVPALLDSLYQLDRGRLRELCRATMEDARDDA